MNLKKSQISFFVIIFMFLIVFVFFMINVNKDNSINKVREVKKKTENKVVEIDPNLLKNKVNECLEQSLTRALIISGLRGGFITKENGENLGGKTFRYINKYTENSYNNDIFSSLNIKTDKLSTLLWLGKYSNFFPDNLKDKNPYKYSIKEDFEKFIKNDTLSCINFTNFKKKGYNIEVLDSEPIINVSFDKLDVKVNFKYNVNLIQENNKISFQETEITKNVRFLQLFLLSSKIIDRKFINRSLNISDKNVLQNIINAENSLSLNASSLSIEKRIIINEEDYKIFNYRIKDHLYPLYNEPYNFNFGYSNVAPYINTSLGSVIVSDDNSTFYFFLKQGQTYKYTLNLIRDHYLDFHYRTNQFVEINKSTPNVDFHLMFNGSMNITIKTLYVFVTPVKVTDGEVSRTYTFVFLPLIIPNTNNYMTQNIIKFRNYEKDESGHMFPIFNKNNLLDKYKNAFSNFYILKDSIFNYTDNTGYHHVYGYGLRGGKVEIDFYGAPNQQHTIDFDSECTSHTDKTCIIENLDSVKEITFTLKDPTGVIINTYNFTVYPADCLGPAPEYNSSIWVKIGASLGWSANTCCNLEPVMNSIKNNNPLEIHNLYSNVKAFDFDALLCYRLSEDNLNNINFVQNNIFWNTDLDDVFKTRLKATCKGTFPIALENLDSGSGNYRLVAFSENDNDNEININPINLNLETKYDTNLCEFCHLKDQLSMNFILIKQGSSSRLNFDVGFSGSDKYEVIPNTNPSIWPFCENNYYGISSITEPNWLDEIFGNGVYDTNKWRSKVYCNVDGSFTCGRISKYSPSAEQGPEDSKPACIDYYFNSEIFESQPAPSSWVCGTVTIHRTCCGPPDESGVVHCSTASSSCNKKCSGVDYTCLSCTPPNPCSS